MSPLPFFLFIFRHFGVCNQHIILFCIFRWRRKTKFKVQNIMKKEELYTLHTKKRMDECGVRTHLFVSVCINQNEFLWMNFFVRKIKCVCMRLTYKSFVGLSWRSVSYQSDCILYNRQTIRRMDRFCLFQWNLSNLSYS